MKNNKRENQKKCIIKRCFKQIAIPNTRKILFLKFNDNKVFAIRYYMCKNKFWNYKMGQRDYKLGQRLQIVKKD